MCLFASCGPKNPPVDTPILTQEELQLIGEWKCVNKEIDGKIKPIKGSLTITSENLKILSKDRIEITCTSPGLPIYPMNEKNEYQYQIVAKTYLLLTNSEGEIITYKRPVECPAVKNVNKTFVGTWRFVKSIWITGEVTTTDDLNFTSHYLELTPYTEASTQNIATKGMGGGKDEDEQGERLRLNYSLIICDILVNQGYTEGYLPNIKFITTQEQKEVPWTVSPWKEVKDKCNPALSKSWKMSSEKCDTLLLYNRYGTSWYVYIGE